MFDEQPDGDPHGECAAEIHRLSEQLTRAKNLLVRLHDRHPETRSLIEGSTGSWFVRGVDRGALQVSAGEPVQPAPVEPPPSSWDEKALATAREISLMWGHDRSHFVSKIQCAVLNAMRWASPAEPKADEARALRDALAAVVCWCLRESETCSPEVINARALIAKYDAAMAKADQP